MGKSRGEFRGDGLNTETPSSGVGSRGLVAVGHTFLDSHKVAIVFLHIIKTIQLAEWDAFSTNKVMVTAELLLSIEIDFRATIGSGLIWTRWNISCETFLIFLVHGADRIVLVADLNAFYTLAEIGVLNTKVLLIFLIAIFAEERHLLPVNSEFVPGTEYSLHFQKGFDFIYLFINPLLFRFLLVEPFQNFEALFLDSGLVHLPHNVTLAESLSLESSKIFSDHELLVISDCEVMDVAALIELMDFLLL